MGEVIALLFRADLTSLLVGGSDDASRSVIMWEQSLIEVPQRIRGGIESTWSTPSAKTKRARCFGAGVPLDSESSL